MNINGFVRRVDKLGRIVLPRTIRKNLNIKDDSSFSISVNEKDEIVLRQFSFLDNSLSDINTIFKLLSKYLSRNEEVLLVDNNRILLSTRKDSKYIDYNINSELFEKISTRQNSSMDKNLPAPFKEEKKILIFPLIIYGDLFGALVCLNVQENSVVNFVKDLIEASF